MMRTVLSFKTLASVMGLVAMLTMGGAAPAMAQSQGFGFGLHFGDEESDFFFGEDNDRDRYPERLLCMTNRQIRDSIANRGYSDISLNVANQDEIQVRATRDGWVYLLDFNFCSDRIEGRQRLRRAG
jgi:hypothetical protein